jgi:glutathione peroxidase
MFAKFGAKLTTLLSVAVSFCSKGEFHSNYSDLYSIPVKTISGEEKNLAEFKGKVLLVVNLASKCGFTYQYEGLEKLYKKYQDQGFVILGFPSNDFLSQEPGTNDEIQNFCKVRFGVTFPLFDKKAVTGKEIQPVYTFLLSKLPKSEQGNVLWNFEKILVDRRGNPLQRFRSTTKPEDSKIESALLSALKN